MSSYTHRLLRESFEAHGARGPGAHGEYQLNCPFCEERAGKVDDKYKLSANPAAEKDGVKGGWRCWRCDARGWGGLDFLEPQEPEPPKAADLRAPRGFVPFRGNEGSVALAPYREHVQRRGVYDFAEAVGAGGCIEGRYAGRVVVPHVVGGRWAGFSARAIQGQEPKYLYPPGMERRSALWGLDWVPADDEPVWIVEGVFDALPLFPYGLATFGKGVTQEQIERIAGLGKRVVCCLDGDAWQECYALSTRIAWRRAASGARELRVGWARLPPEKDPGVLGWAVKNFVVGAM